MFYACLHSIQVITLAFGRCISSTPRPASNTGSSTPALREVPAVFFNKRRWPIKTVVTASASSLSLASSYLESVKQQVLELLPCSLPFTSVGRPPVTTATWSAASTRQSMGGLDWARSQFRVLLALSNPRRSCSAKNSRATPTESRIRRSRTPCAVRILLCQSVRNGRFRSTVAAWTPASSTTGGDPLLGSSLSPSEAEIR